MSWGFVIYEIAFIIQGISKRQILNIFLDFFVEKFWQSVRFWVLIRRNSTELGFFILISRNIWNESRKFLNIFFGIFQIIFIIVEKLLFFRQFSKFFLFFNNFFFGWIPAKLFLKPRKNISHASEAFFFFFAWRRNRNYTLCQIGYIRQAFPFFFYMFCRGKTCQFCRRRFWNFRRFYIYWFFQTK